MLFPMPNLTDDELHRITDDIATALGEP